MLFIRRQRHTRRQSPSGAGLPYALVSTTAARSLSRCTKTSTPLDAKRWNPRWRHCGRVFAGSAGVGRRGCSRQCAWASWSAQHDAAAVTPRAASARAARRPGWRSPMPLPRQALQLSRCARLGGFFAHARASLVVGGAERAVIADAVRSSRSSWPSQLQRRPLRSRRRWPEIAALVAITALAAVAAPVVAGEGAGRPLLRRRRSRSMPLSLHNFLLGAYEPGGSLAVDKPPLDLWLQVLSTQLFGFGSFTLKLPSALAGTRGRGGALRRGPARASAPAPASPSALALATLPIALLTARSDTDGRGRDGCSAWSRCGCSCASRRTGARAGATSRRRRWASPSTSSSLRGSWACRP